MQSSILEIHLTNNYEKATDEIYKQIRIDTDFFQVKEEVFANMLRMDSNPFAKPSDVPNTHYFSVNNVMAPSPVSPSQTNMHINSSFSLYSSPTSRH